MNYDLFQYLKIILSYKQALRNGRQIALMAVLNVQNKNISLTNEAPVQSFQF